MGQGVVDQQTGNRVFYPDGVSSDEIEKSMSNFNNGTITEGKPSWYDQFIKAPIQRTTGNFNFDPVMTAKSAIGGAEEAIAPLTHFVGLQTPVPTSQEREAFKEVSPASNLISNAITQVGSFFGLETLTGGIGGIFSKIPAVAKFIEGASTATKAAQEAGTVSAEGIKVAQGAAKFGVTTGEYGALSSTEQQKETYGNVQISDVAKEAIKQGITGLVTGGVLAGATKPLADLGADESIVKELSKRMVASGTVMGATTAAQGGSPRDVMLSTVVGGLFPMVHLHGEIQEVRDNVIQSTRNAQVANIMSQTGMDYSTALQIAHERMLNQAEDVINQSNASVMEKEPLPIEERQSATKTFSDPHDPALLDHLSQFFSPHYIVHIDGGERVWLGNQPLKSLNAWAEQHKDIDWENAIKEDYLRKPYSEILDDDARRARGIPVDKNALDEVASSKELTTNLIANTLNEVTGGSSAEGTGTETKQGSKQAQGVEQGKESGLPVGNIKKDGVETTTGKEVEGGQQKTPKSAKDINSEFIEQGFKDIPLEEQAKFSSLKGKFNEQKEKVSELMNDRQLVNDILEGNKPLPDGIHPEIFWRGVSNRAIAEGDGKTGLLLARSPITKNLALSAQTMAAAKTFDTGGLGGKVDPVKEIKELDKAKSERTSKQIAKKIDKELKEGIAKVKKETVIKQSEFEKFMSLIRC